MLRYAILTIGCVLLFAYAFPNPVPDGRISYTINEGWRFRLQGSAYAKAVDYNDEGWATVQLPHTWNSSDPFDNDRDYFRGIGWYRKHLTLDSALQSKKIFLYFEGANQVTDVYVNGAFAGRHTGGYTPFTIEVGRYLHWEKGADNVIAVQVNNAHDPFIPPLDIGYALYGGIYRNVWLIATNDLHFTTVDNTSGVWIKTPNVSASSANVAITTSVTNGSAEKRNFRFVNTLYDAEGKIVKSVSSDLTAGPGETVDGSATIDNIAAPELWSPEHPYLYEMRSQLKESGKLVDEVRNPVGFRWYSFSANEGFSLNGKKYRLKGTNRHQDMQGKGSALSSADHRRDMELIKDMGANFVRLAHYPQAPEVLRAADELGLIIWEEVPIINFMTLQPAFLHNAFSMVREMIRAHYNHPAIFLWGANNEILLYGEEGERIQKHDQDSAYVWALKKYVYSIDSLIRAEDPTRYSVMAMHASGDYSGYGIDDIPQVGGHNIYSGWYSGVVDEFGKILDRIHAQHPNQVVFVSEYGAESDRRLNSEQPERMDYTGQYQRYYNESYLRQINARPWLAGSAIWNEFDFSQPNIGGTIPHLNQKGMMTWDRQPKDVYYFYKANWNPEPMVYIATRDWMQRGGILGDESTFDIYANTNSVQLYLNGKSLGKKTPDDLHKCSWKVALQPGKNELRAVSKTNGKTIEDKVTVTFNALPADLKQMKGNFSLLINTGFPDQYTDAQGNIWLGDKPYTSGSFGHTGGVGKVFPRKETIHDTDDEPLFYSSLEGFEKYTADVPDGLYELELNFIEDQYRNKGERVFDISVNGNKIFPNIDLAAQYGFGHAVRKTFRVLVQNGQGITIAAAASTGKSIISGLRIRKIADQ
jgi:beta-galactosidase